LIALEQMPARLAEDHANAKLLARGLAELPGVSIDPAKVVTNIVIFDIRDTGIAPEAFEAAAEKRGVLLGGVGGTRIRVVTHLDVSRKDCEQALAALASILS
jgi:threonine aldolase